MSNLNPIEQLSEEVSWVKEYALINPDKTEWRSGSLPSIYDIYGIITDGEDPLMAIAVKSFEEASHALALLRSSQKQVWLLIEENLSLEQIETLVFNKPREGIIFHFLDVKSQIHYNRFIVSALDGLDWGRSLTLNKPVYEWE